MPTPEKPQTQQRREQRVEFTRLAWYAVAGITAIFFAMSSGWLWRILLVPVAAVCVATVAFNLPVLFANWRGQRSGDVDSGSPD